jgi:hypothetical protein
MLLIQLVATSQQHMPADSSSLVTSPRPLVDASRRLQETYGKVVTYEEPVLTWRGELEGEPNRNPETKWGLFPKVQGFVMPESRPDIDLATILEKTIAAYHQQTTGTRFRLSSSTLGYHIVPVLVHDENGRLIPATSLLDQVVSDNVQIRNAG